MAHCDLKLDNVLLLLPEQEEEGEEGVGAGCVLPQLLISDFSEAVIFSGQAGTVGAGPMLLESRWGRGYMFPPHTQPPGSSTHDSCDNSPSPTSHYPVCRGTEPHVCP